MAQFTKVVGAKETERRLLALPVAVAKRIGRRALRAGAKPIYDFARAKVPVREGRVKRSIRLRVDQLRQAGATAPVLSAMIYVSGKLGYRPRKTRRQSRVKGKLGPARYSYQIGTLASVIAFFLERGTVDTPPEPFLRPAWDAQGGQAAIERIGKELGEGIEREAANL